VTIARRFQRINNILTQVQYTIVSFSCYSRLNIDRQSCTSTQRIQSRIVTSRHIINIVRIATIPVVQCHDRWHRCCAGHTFTVDHDQLLSTNVCSYANIRWLTHVHVHCRTTDVVLLLMFNVHNMSVHSWTSSTIINEYVQRDNLVMSRLSNLWRHFVI
jgi:hypothetical protein